MSNRTRSYVLAAAVAVGVMAPAPVASAAPAPQLCSAAEEQDESGNAARCHVQRAASAAYRAVEAADYARVRKGDLAHPIDFQQLDSDVAQAVASAKRAAEPEDTDEKYVRSRFREATFYSSTVANAVGRGFGGVGKVTSDRFDPPLYVGAIGDAVKAADNASHIAGLAGNAKWNTEADKAEAAAIEAYKTAGWIAD